MSTRESRRTFVSSDQTLDSFRVLGDGEFAIDPPVACKRGWYRADLDLATRRATLTLIALVPEEGSHE